MTEKRAAGLGRFPTAGRIMPTFKNMRMRSRMMNDHAFRLNPSVRVPGRTALRSRSLLRDRAARANPEVSAARRGPVKVPRQMHRRAPDRHIQANMVIPALPGLSSLLRTLTKRDISGTAPGFGARLSGTIAGAASTVRRSSRPRPATPRGAPR